MGKTRAIRKFVSAYLAATDGKTYHRRAAANAVYPYKVYMLTRANLEDTAMDVYDLTVDIYDRGDNPGRVEDLADAIEEMFRYANLPQDTILPTIWRENRQWVEDDDKELQRLQLRFTIQLYTKS